VKTGLARMTRFITEIRWGERSGEVDEKAEG